MKVRLSEWEALQVPVLNCTIYGHKDDSTGCCVQFSGNECSGADDIGEFMDSSCAKGV